MMRILLFLATNIGVLLVLSFTLKLLGIDSYLSAQGLNYQSLLVFAAVMGFGVLSFHWRFRSGALNV